MTGPVLASIGLLGASVAFTAFPSVASPSPASFLPGTVVAEFTEVGVTDWVVPDNVCEVSITAAGAQGGAGSPADGQVSTLPGGQGAVAHSRVTVTPGETLRIRVGGAGGDGVWDETATEGGAGGFNGGGDGGAGGPDGGGGGGGGGGASDVRQGGDGLADRIVVGGGGGGGGAYSNVDVPDLGNGGVGGNPGADGGPGVPVDPGDEFGGEAATGGGGATATAGGAGGAGGFFGSSGDDPAGEPFPGGPGSLGSGGDGGTAPNHGERAGGGGGGGGLFGGGGGGAASWEVGAGGGGGSSLGDRIDQGGAETAIGDMQYPDGHGGDGIVVIAGVPGCTTDDPTPPGDNPPADKPGNPPAPDQTGPRDVTTPPGHTGVAPAAQAVTARPDYTG